MWPDSDELKWDEWMEDTVLYVKGRLTQYGSLRGFEDRLAGNGVARTREIARYLEQYGGYFAPPNSFTRWSRVASYRESLRFVLQPEPVEMAFEGLGADARIHLRLRYIDQLNDEEVARVLNLQGSGLKHRYDAASARSHSLAAYCELEQAFARLRPAATGAIAGPGLFPFFPNSERTARNSRHPGEKS